MTARRRVVVFLMISACAGCGAKPDVGKPPEGVPAGKITPLTDAKAARFGHAVEAAVKAGDLAALAKLIDLDAIANAAVAPLDMPDKQKKANAVALRDGLAGPNSFFDTLVKNVAAGGSYKWLHTRRTKQGETTAIFRLLQPEGGMNYQEMKIVSMPHGAVVATDVFVIMTGESLSETLGRTLKAMLAGEGKPGGLFSGKGAPKDNRSDVLIAMSKALRENHPEQVLALYHSLPAEAKNVKAILLLRLHAASKFDQAQYTEAIEDFERRFPGDSSLDLVSIDGYFLKKQYDKAAAALERLANTLGGDPYLDGLRANVFNRLNQPEKADQLGREAVKADPALEGGYAAVLTSSLTRKDFKTTAEYLDLYNGKFDATSLQVAATPDYEYFRASPEGKAWLAKHAGDANPMAKKAAGAPASAPRPGALRKPAARLKRPGRNN